ncbi:MAG TPA: response regulator [Oculatellaceae cyanobacterium]
MIELYKAAVWDPDACLGNLNKVAGADQLTLTKAASADDLINSVVVNEPDIVLLDYELPDMSGKEMAARVREVNPAIPILLMSGNPDWTALEKDPNLDMVKSPVDPNEVVQRILKLVRGAKENASSGYRLPKMIVDDLRSDSGRLDAKLIAEMFGLSIPALAQTIKAGEQALYKTPDSISVQSKLIGFERIAWGLLKLTGSIKGLRIWLNAPNDELDKELPIDYIKEGHVDDVAAMVEDTLLGHPS